MASWLHLRAVAFVICMTEFTTKADWQLVPQVTYSVIKCEGKFSKERLEIFKCTWVKSLLETNLASSVKPSIVKISVPGYWSNMESFLVYLFNFYYAISELEQNKQNNTIIFFSIYFFNKKVDLSSLRGGAGAPIAPPSLRAWILI